MAKKGTPKKEEAKPKPPPVSPAEQQGWELVSSFISRIMSSLRMLPPPLGAEDMFTGPHRIRNMDAAAKRFIGAGEVPEELTELRRAMEGLYQTLENGPLPGEIRDQLVAHAAAAWKAAARIQQLLTGQRPLEERVAEIKRLATEELLPSLSHLQLVVRSRTPPRIPKLTVVCEKKEGRHWYLYVRVDDAPKPVRLLPAPSRILLTLNLLRYGCKARVQPRALHELYRTLPLIKGFVEPIGAQIKNTHCFTSPRLYSVLVDERPPESRQIQPYQIKSHRT